MANCAVCKKKIGVFQDSYAGKDEQGEKLFPCCGPCSDKTIEKFDNVVRFKGVEEKISDAYRCGKCQECECEMRRIAATGTGLSKIFDIQHNSYLAVSCQNCGFTELFDAKVLDGRKDLLPNLLDLFFGR